MQVGAGKPYREKLQRLLASVSTDTSVEISDPLLDVREVQREGFLVFASNKGLAGSYNNHLLLAAYDAIQASLASGHEVGVIAVGKKTVEFFEKRNVPIDERFLDVHDVPHVSDSNAIAKYVRSAYATGQYDKVTLVYQEFFSVMSQKPSVSTLLPLHTDTASEETTFEVEYLFEPSAGEILSQLLPLYLSNQIHSALADAKAGEHGARMTAMTAATDNAGELLKKLEISYNRARQAAITNEISEIVAGADALS